MTTETINGTTTPSIADSVKVYLEEGKLKPNGTRDIPTAAFMGQMEKHGVTKDSIKLYHDALAQETTAASEVASLDLIDTIGNASKEDLKNEEFRKNLSASVRLPTYGGSTEIEHTAERFNNVPARGDQPASRQASYGAFRVKVNTKGRVHKEVLESAQSRVREALGIKD